MAKVRIIISVWTAFIRFSQLYYWSDSNFIPMESKKFEFWIANWAIRIYIKNELEIVNMRSGDFSKIFEPYTKIYGRKYFINFIILKVFLKSQRSHIYDF